MGSSADLLLEVSFSNSLPLLSTSEGLPAKQLACNISKKSSQGIMRSSCSSNMPNAHFNRSSLLGGFCSEFMSIMSRRRKFTKPLIVPAMPTKRERRWGVSSTLSMRRNCLNSILFGSYISRASPYICLMALASK
ncbi:hypothetical protein FGO68_gene2896 [Halteria grandinella]|uniref:Uncharacterized protein n=1 Tax=Halteria grandinella TaxID=5974 RepID=A0A8J8NFI6_HALGN|nr:hypothetical protein FGO68_gene2896 [Halteria grandinella]